MRTGGTSASDHGCIRAHWRSGKARTIHPGARPRDQGVFAEELAVSEDEARLARDAPLGDVVGRVAGQREVRGRVVGDEARAHGEQRLIVREGHRGVDGRARGEQLEGAARGRGEEDLAAQEAVEDAGGARPEAVGDLVVVVRAALVLGEGEEEEARVEAAGLGLGGDPAGPRDERVEGQASAARDEGVGEGAAALELGAHGEDVGVGERVHEGEDGRLFEGLAAGGDGEGARGGAVVRHEGCARVRIGRERGPRVGGVGGVDLAAGEHDGAPEERGLLVPEHAEDLEARGGRSEDDDGGGWAWRGGGARGIEVEHGAALSREGARSNPDALDVRPLLPATSGRGCQQSPRRSSTCVCAKTAGQ
jgi:hypothetical protein